MSHMTASGQGWMIATLDDLGDGPGFRKVRKALGVEAFGVNAIVMPPGMETGFHWHERQDELYFVHAGTIEMEFGDGDSQELTAGAFAHVRAATHRKVRNTGGSDAIYIVVGGKDGYVGRDAHAPQGTARVSRSG
jgi:mannose-6-phosphate isomerase-like protein (cupin superfamily)